MRHSLLLTAVLLSAGIGAHADTLLTFNNVTTADNAIITGSFTINPAGTITALDFGIAVNGQVNTYTSVSDVQFAGEFSPNYYIQIQSDQGDQFAAGPPPGGQISLVLPPDTLAGYMGGYLCSASYSCSIGSSYSKNYTAGNDAFNEILTGSLNATSVTPEPGSLVLLGTGALGLVGAARRRLKR